ncbi:hypothetical protein BN970_02847 [Mycolicibacterium conceptionense]|uniref:Uncharacterized protein n=1 Tax=Mycolicibacterium conceptionense TaxID=451644 RepID=A0A0U1DE88_9MYCO|nr:hypothetical protein BN970_02847 [Mycolicibacterium conceptionense]
MPECPQAADKLITIPVGDRVDQRMLTADIGDGCVGRAEVDHRYRLLRIKVPIQDADKGFHDVLDDDRTARGAQHGV